MAISCCFDQEYLRTMFESKLLKLNFFFLFYQATRVPVTHFSWVITLPIGWPDEVRLSSHPLPHVVSLTSRMYSSFVGVKA